MNDYSQQQLTKKQK